MCTRKLLPCSEEVLYSQAQATLQTIQKKITHQKPDAAFKQYYIELQTTYTEALQIDIKKHCFTDTLSLRNDILEKSQDCEVQWDYLKNYVLYTYPPHIHKVLLKLIGSENHPVGLKNDYHQLKETFACGWAFIKENEKEISHAIVLPNNFIKQYKLSYFGFLKALKTYQAKTIENRNIFTEHKVHNLRLYETLQKILVVI
jgi:hypothetical protein